MLKRGFLQPLTLGINIAVAASVLSGCGVKIRQITAKVNRVLAPENIDSLDLKWLSDTHSFGAVYQNTSSASAVLTFKNLATSSATFCSGLTLDNTVDFTIVSETCGTSDIPAFSDCTATVRANPTLLGNLETDLAQTCIVLGQSVTAKSRLSVNSITPALAWSPLTSNFGPITVGGTSGGVLFFLTNTGTGNASGCSAPVLSNTTDFVIASDGCSTSNVASGGGSCTLAIRAAPASSGAKTATLSRTCTVGGTVATTLTGITVTGVAPATLAWSPLVHAFGNITAGAHSVDQNFTLTNSGGANATGCGAPSLSNTTDFSIQSDNCVLSTLGGGANCSVSLRANPASAGAKTATLSRTCTVGGTPTTTANQITVTGVAPAALAWSPLTHAFGNVATGASTASQTFTLTNGGGTTASSCSVPALNNTTDFTLMTDGCSTSNLAAAATCSVTIQANPTTLGAKTTTLSRVCTVGGTITTTAEEITVTGITPVSLAWTPLVHDFGTVVTGTNSVNQNFVLANGGGVNATGCAAPTLSNTTDFTIATDGCAVTDVASGGGSCTVAIHANPSATGAKTATLSRVCTVGGTITTTTNQITTTGIAPVSLAWTPLTHAFPDLVVGASSANQNFVLTNSGGVNATGCSAPVLSNTTDFSVVTDGCAAVDLPAGGGTCTVALKANPASTGAKTATLSRACTVGGSPSTTTNQITVTGLSPVSIAWTPLNHAFGDVTTGTNSSDHTFTLTNSGDVAASGCSAPTLSNSTDFTIATDNCAVADVAGSATCTVLIQAKPVSAGAKTTTLSRVCTVGGTVSTTANQISTTGIAPVNLAWTPLIYAFGNVNTGSSSSDHTFTLANSGGIDASGCSAPTISNITDFTIVTDGCAVANVTSGGSCAVDIHANPTTVGAKATTLSRVCTVGGTVSTTANQITTTGIAPANFAWTPLTHAFGNVTLGDTATAEVFTLTNLTASSLTGCSAPTLSNSTDFVMSTDGCGTTDMAASATCTVSIRGKPASAGTKSTTLSRICTVGGTASTTTNGIAVVGVAPTGLAWDRQTYDFGDVVMNQMSAGIISFTLKNWGGTGASGCGPVTLSNSTDFIFGMDTCGGSSTLAAGSGQCSMSISATPKSVGVKTTTVSRTCTVGGTATNIVDGYTVNGLPTAASLAWSPMSYGFGTVFTNATSAKTVFTITNSGGTAATGCSAPTIGDLTNFEITDDTCATADLAGASSCTVSVRAKPTTSGLKRTRLTRICSSGGTIQTTNNGISTTGSTPSPSLAWLQQSDLANFEAVRTLGTKADLEFHLTNGGSADASGCASPYLLSTANFSIVSDTCGTANLATKDSCTVVVRASPATDGSKNTTLRRVCTTGGTKDKSISATGSLATVLTMKHARTTVTCMLMSDGTVRCWGVGYTGASDGDPRTIPTPIVGITTAIALASGDEHFCALLSDQTVMCWGRNSGGEVGGTGTGIVSPRTVAGLAGATAIAAGGTRSCAILSDLTVKCWGDSTWAPLGDGGTTDRRAPVAITGLTNVTGLSLGSSSSCARMGDGTLKCWGGNDDGQVGDGTFVTRKSPVDVAITGVIDVGVSAMDNFTCALISGGTVSCWGSNSYGTIGNGNTNDRKNPTSVTGITDAVSLSVGAHNSCVVRSGGGTYCWGKNDENQINASATAVVKTATAGYVYAADVADFVLGGATTCAILSDHSVQCHGLLDRTDPYYILSRGDGFSSSDGLPRSLGLTNIEEVATGNKHVCVRFTDGTVKCWGGNDKKQLGDGTTITRLTPVSAAVTNVVSLSAGGDRTCAILSDGTGKCWGEGLSVTAVTDLTGASKVSVGVDSACALVTGGEIRCWGANASGQIGDGTTTARAAATAVSSLSNALSISVGYSTACAALSDGTAKCWGANGATGMLGDGTTSSSSVPVTVSNLTDVKSIAVGAKSVFAVTNSGTMSSWGSFTATLVPSEIAGITRAVSVSTGTDETKTPKGSYACASLSDGRVQCIGAGVFGQLGDGKFTDRAAAVYALGIIDATSVSSSPNGSTTCARKSTGDVACWGRNDYSQTGRDPSPFWSIFGIQ